MSISTKFYTRKILKRRKEKFKKRSVLGVMKMSNRTFFVEVKIRGICHLSG